MNENKIKKLEKEIELIKITMKKQKDESDKYGDTITKNIREIKQLMGFLQTLIEGRKKRHNDKDNIRYIG